MQLPASLHASRTFVAQALRTLAARVAPALTPASTLDAARAVGRDWTASPYYDVAEPCMDDQWAALLWPRLRDWDFSCVVDLAAGHGRNSAKLLPLAGRLYIVDINHENIAACRARFGADPRVTYVHNDGVSLAGIPDASVSTLYCFDAMVHFDSDVVRAYLREARRILRPGGRALCHHSNYTGAPGGLYSDNPHWRNFMSRELFAHYCKKEGLEVLSGDLLDWAHDGSNLDCITTFRRGP